MRKLSFLMTAVAAIAVFAFQASAQQLGSGNPSDTDLLNQRKVEKPSASGPGIFDVAVPSADTKLQPVKRVPRDKYGVVGPLPLTVNDLDALVYPGTTPGAKNELLEGLTFFTKVHTPGESPLTDDHGAGPMNNQPFCQGCHQNAQEAVKTPGLLGPKCINGSGCASPVARAGRSTPTNFAVTSLNPFADTGGGLPADILDAINNTGKTAAFTTFGDFTPSLQDKATLNGMNLPTIGFFDPLDNNTHPLTDGTSPKSQPFGGFVQHVRPSVDACVPKPLPPVTFDTNLNGSNTNKFRRSVGERGAPPYLGRGLMEAVPTQDLLAYTDPKVENGKSSLDNFAKTLGCSPTGCISGKANTIPTTPNFVSGAPGRFGLRANGVELLQFVVGGMQGELSLTNALNTAESNFPTLFPSSGPTTEPAACLSAASPASSPEVFLSTVFSIRALMRNIAPPEFGDALLNVLRSRDPSKPLPGNNTEAMVQRGAQLFGIDLVAFANRTVRGPMVAGGDKLDDNAINQKDRQLNCVGCHTPIHRTGLSPAATFNPLTNPTEVGAENLSNVWAPIFSDLLLHKMPVIDAERNSTLPRDPVQISRLPTDGGNNDDFKDGDDFRDNSDGGKGKHRFVDTFDLSRNLADDTFTGQKAIADGREFRTPPLMALGRIGPPFLHDSRVYLSKDTVNGSSLSGTGPAGTVTTNRKLTNAPLVVHTLDDALVAAIELHDLPAPDDRSTPRTSGAGCPVPPEVTNIIYGPSRKDAADAICPPYGKDPKETHSTRSDSAEVIYRFRQLSSDDQQALIEFLKQL